MLTVNICDAKANLSRLVERAATLGEAFVIARAGRPLVMVVPLERAEAAPPRRIGFLKGRFTVPDDFKDIGRVEIEGVFGGDA